MDALEREMLVFGYMKEIQQTMVLSYKIPKGIRDLVLLFFPRMFRFENIDIKGVKVSKNGLIITKQKDMIVNIQFGEFLHASDAVIYDVTFTLEHTYRDALSFGFMTPEFKLPSDIVQDWNFGQNHSLTVNGNGYICTSEEFKTKIEYNRYIDGCHPDDPFWTATDKLYIKIDMIKQIGKMWSDHEPLNILEIGLPESVAILLDWGGSEQTLSVEYQEFRYL